MSRIPHGFLAESEVFLASPNPVFPPLRQYFPTHHCLPKDLCLLQTQLPVVVYLPVSATNNYRFMAPLCCRNCEETLLEHSYQMPWKVHSQKRGVQPFNVNGVAYYMVCSDFDNRTETLAVHHKIVRNSAAPGVGGGEHQLLFASTAVL